MVSSEQEIIHIKPEIRYTRREAIALGAAGAFTALGAAGVFSVIKDPLPIYAEYPATPEPTVIPGDALSTVKDEQINSYRNKYSIFGNTEGIAINLPEDKNIVDIVVPQVLLEGILQNYDWADAKGYKLFSYGNYKKFVEGYLAIDDAKSDIALGLYNPYSYLPGQWYKEKAVEVTQEMRDPHMLFANTVITWGLFPDALIERWDGLPEEFDSPDHQTQAQGEIVPSWEKSLTRQITQETFNFAASLIRQSPTEGEGAVSTRLSSVAPRLSHIKVAMDV